ncbi:MAG TPA: hypothetical protein VID29_01335 [Solirubrobacteraceae bacterium]
MRPPIVLAAGLALVALAMGATMFGKPRRLLDNNAISNSGFLGYAEGSTVGCQENETLPRGTSAVTLFLEAVFGPKVTVTAQRAGRTIARGAVGTGWTGGSVTIPIAPTPRTTSRVKVCFSLGPGNEEVSELGNLTPANLALIGGEGKRLRGRMRIEYLADGEKSWWSLALQVARRMGLGHALTGTWVAFLLALLMLATASLTSWLVLRETR